MACRFTERWRDPPFGRVGQGLWMGELEPLHPSSKGSPRVSPARTIVNSDWVFSPFGAFRAGGSAPGEGGDCVWQFRKTKVVGNKYSHFVQFLHDFLHFGKFSIRFLLVVRFPSGISILRMHGLDVTSWILCNFFSAQVQERPEAQFSTFCLIAHP